MTRASCQGAANVQRVPVSVRRAQDDAEPVDRIRAVMTGHTVKLARVEDASFSHTILAPAVGDLRVAAPPLSVIIFLIRTTARPLRCCPLNPARNQRLPRNRAHHVHRGMPSCPRQATEAPPRAPTDWEPGSSHLSERFPRLVGDHRGGQLHARPVLRLRTPVDVELEFESDKGSSATPRLLLQILAVHLEVQQRPQLFLNRLKNFFVELTNPIRFRYVE